MRSWPPCPPIVRSLARQPEDELSLAELLQVVGRRRWLLLGCIFLGGLAGMAALGALTPVYDARALLIIEPDSGARAGATVPTASQTPDSASVDSQVQILASRSLAREAIQALGLAADPRTCRRRQQGALAALLRRQTPPTPAPAGRRGRPLHRATLRRARGQEPRHRRELALGRRREGGPRREQAG